MPIPDSQVDIEIDDYEDLLAVENQIEENFVAIAPPPKGFPGEFVYDFLSQVTVVPIGKFTSTVL